MKLTRFPIRKFAISQISLIYNLYSLNKLQFLHIISITACYKNASTSRKIPESKVYRYPFNISAIHFERVNG